MKLSKKKWIYFSKIDGITLNTASELNNIINRTDITAEQRLAAQHASQDLQMDAISRSVSSRADAEREFNVDETFGSGRNPDPDAMSAKEQREAQQKGTESTSL